jgi:hypothetical protein
MFASSLLSRPLEGSRVGALVSVAGTALAAILVCGSPARAGLATALLRQNDPLPGFPGHTVSDLYNTAVNHAGGYAVNMNSTDGLSTLSHIWGNASGGAGSVLRTEGTFGDLVQNSFEFFYGMADGGEIAYSAFGTGGPVGNFDSVWLDDMPVAVEGDPVTSLPGQYWTFASRPGITAVAKPYWGGGIASVAGGTTQNRGLFFGMGADVVLLGGVAVPGLPFPPSTTATEFDYRFSALGSHFISPVTMSSGSSTNDGAVVMNGSGLLINGALVREGDPVPAAVGGFPGETWGTFRFTGVTETSEWFFVGNTSVTTLADEIVVKNGAVLYREGDELDERTVIGDIDGAYMNEDGDIALVWVIEDATPLEALYVNDQVALVQGDVVDFDGDGSADPGATVVDFTGISALTMSDRDMFGIVRVYCTAYVDTANTVSRADDSECLLCIEATTPGSTSVPLDGPLMGRLTIAPNPSVGPAVVRYELARDAQVAITIFDVSGRLVARLEGGALTAGPHECAWDGRDAGGRLVAPGTYMLRIDDGSAKLTQRIVRLR